MCVNVHTYTTHATAATHSIAKVLFYHLLYGISIEMQEATD